ncbi:MAG: carbohydrate ABC transporter permease [Enterocloster sp.]|jgi:sn-glycerol 3-phosphate transport system permease protein|nr:carbohydrate ABC transporter permease [Clostridium sp.]MBP8868821.1 carbohydrate ABC transporter permease [Enterocloster sp.]MBS5086907.1 carbohydrate ABC transporter permease [Clostridiaceae bacterium]
MKKKGRILGGALNAALKLLLIFLIAYPFIWMVFTSFKPYKETTIYPPTLLPTNWTTEGYVKALEMVDVATFLKNSLIVSLTVLVLQYLVIVPAAYAFARCKFRFKGFFFGIVLLGFMIPQQVTFIPIYLMFSKAGLLQSLIPQILPFISNAFGIFLLRQYFMQIPEEIIEAARLDDAGELKIILRIMIPMARPAIFTIGLLSFISSWNSYFWPLIMTTKDAYRTLPIGVAMLNSQEGGRLWNVLMAGNMFLVVPILIVYLFANKQIRKAFAYSGIK